MDLYEEMGKVPLMVAISAHINEEIRKKCIAIGFNIIIETPLTVKKIEEEILKPLRVDKKVSKNVDNLINENNSN